MWLHDILCGSQGNILRNGTWIKNALPPPSLGWWLPFGMLPPPLYWPPNCASATKLIPPSNLPMAIKYNWCSLWTRIVTLSAVLHHNFSFKFIQLHVMRKTTILGRVKRGCGGAQSHWLLTVVRWGKSMGVLYTYRGLLSVSIVGCGVKEWLWATQEAKGLSGSCDRGLLLANHKLPTAFSGLKGQLLIASVTGILHHFHIFYSWRYSVWLNIG